MIGAGHRRVDIDSYTLAQCQGYLDAIARDERRRQRDWLVILRAAQAEEKGFKQTMAWLAAKQPGQHAQRIGRTEKQRRKHKDPVGDKRQGATETGGQQ